MLTDQEKENLKRQWLMQVAYWGRLPLTIYPTKIGQFYVTYFPRYSPYNRMGLSKEIFFAEGGGRIF